jgi:hypothetical protein
MTSTITKTTDVVVLAFALQMNRLNAEKNYAYNKKKELETDQPRGWKKDYERLNHVYDKAEYGMKSLETVFKTVINNPVDVYNEMERHWQEDLTQEQKQGYASF